MNLKGIGGGQYDAYNIYSTLVLYYLSFTFSLHRTWGSNSQPRDQEPHGLLTEPARLIFYTRKTWWSLRGMANIGLQNTGSSHLPVNYQALGTWSLFLSSGWFINLDFLMPGSLVFLRDSYMEETGFSSVNLLS